MYEFVLFQHVFYPTAGLKLWVDHHWILQSFWYNKRTIYWHCVFWKSEIYPIRNLQIISDYTFEIIIVRESNLLLF